MQATKKMLTERLEAIDRSIERAEARLRQLRLLRADIERRIERGCGVRSA